MPLKLLATKFSLGQLFLGFNAVLIAGVGGMLCLMRALAADAYSPLSVDILHIALIGPVWVAALLAFIGMTFCLHYLKRLENIGACLVVFGFLELVFFGFMTLHVFTHAARSHQNEDRAQIVQQVTKINQTAAAMREGDFSLENAYLKGRTLVLQYKNDGQGGLYREAMRKNLVDEACGYLAKYSRHGVVTSVAYIFHLKEGRTTLAFNAKDCDASSKDAKFLPAPAAQKDAQQEKNFTDSPLPQGAALIASPDATQQAGLAENAAQKAPDTDPGIASLTTHVERLQESLNHFNQQLEQLSATASYVTGFWTSPSVKNMQDRLDKEERQIEALSRPAPALVAPAAPPKNDPSAPRPE